MKFEKKRDFENMLLLSPVLLNIMFEMNLWSFKRSLPFNITSSITTLHEDEKIGRKTSTHRTGRAIDISVKNWNMYDIGDFMRHFNNKFYNVAAIVNVKGERVLIPDIRHGTAPHFHVQIDSKYARIIKM